MLSSHDTCAVRLKVNYYFLIQISLRARCRIVRPFKDDGL